jgi:signal transduction histidine kinase
MFVVNNDDRIVNTNESAVEAIDCDRVDALGNLLSTVLNRDTEQLRTAETVTIQIDQATRRYDPQVTSVTDPEDRVFGAIISLRDVTDRQLREERLAVLNRVLRHNIRNDLDVIKGNAESLTADDTRVKNIIETTDSILAYGKQARMIQEYLSESAQIIHVDIPELINDVLETVDGAGTDMSVSVETPPSAQILTDRQKLKAALESAIDNAITYGDSTVTIVVKKQSEKTEIDVIDDGPGVPKWEINSLQTGTEEALQHSTGLGLWQLKWAITSINGNVSFDTADGTTVTITVPNDPPSQESRLR